MNKSVLLALFATILTTSAQLLYKEGANRLPELATNWPLAAGFLIYCFAALILIAALRNADLSVVLPVLATSFVWVSLISVWRFGELLSPINWTGIALIVFGVVLIGGSK